MWYNIFFDQNNNFQWASIAALISFLAFCSSIISIGVTKKQGNKNRKSSTLVNLRIEELKSLREEASTLKSLINNYLHERNPAKNPKFNSGVKPILETDPIIAMIDGHFNKIHSMLYRTDSHGNELSMSISINSIALLGLKDTGQLLHILMNFDKAFQDYSKAEYVDIEKYI